MSENTINPSLYAKHRAVLNTWNLIGKKLFFVRSEVADLKYNDKVREGKLRTSRPIMKYFIEDIEIHHIGVEPLPNNSGAVIQLNNNPKYQFTLGPAKFCDVTLELVTKAIDSQKDGMREPIFFSDGIKLAEQVEKLNKLEIDAADEMANELLNISTMLKSVNKTMKDGIDQYYYELNEAVKS